MRAWHYWYARVLSVQNELPCLDLCKPYYIGYTQFILTILLFVASFDCGGGGCSDL